MSQNERIDIERECLRPLAYNTPEKWVSFVEEIAQRVEESTIQRMIEQRRLKDGYGPVKRFYATPEGAK